MSCTNQFWIDRIAATQAQILQYETAIVNLAAGSILSYTIDTGQTKQTVTKANVSSLQNAVGALYNQLATLEARVYGSGSVYVRPAF